MSGLDIVFTTPANRNTGWPSCNFTLWTSTDNKTFTVRSKFAEASDIQQRIDLSTGDLLTFYDPISSPLLPVKAIRITIYEAECTQYSTSPHPGNSTLAEVQPYPPRDTAILPPFLDVDLGSVYAGQLQVNIAGTSNPPPQLSFAFSETQDNLGYTTAWDYSFTARNTTDSLVPAVGGEVWVDTPGCQFSDGAVCADGVHGFRYVRVFIPQLPISGIPSPHSSPTGWVDISGISLKTSPYKGAVSTYSGHFLSSDDLLNRIWYACAYTAELSQDIYHSYSNDKLIPNVASTNGNRVFFYGPNHRDPYTPAIWVESLVDLVSHGAGSAAKTILLDRATHQLSSGMIGSGDYEQFDYPAYWALTVVDYVLYTGDYAFAAQVWPAFKKLFDVWYPSNRYTETGDDGGPYLLYPTHYYATD